jgi:hypothetical protein
LSPAIDQILIDIGTPAGSAIDAMSPLGIHRSSRGECFLFSHQRERVRDWLPTTNRVEALFDECDAGRATARNASDADAMNGMLMPKDL